MLDRVGSVKREDTRGGCGQHAPVDDAVSDDAGQGGDGNQIERGVASERQPCHLRGASDLHDMFLARKGVLLAAPSARHAALLQHYKQAQPKRARACPELRRSSSHAAFISQYMDRMPRCGLLL